MMQESEPKPAGKTAAGGHLKIALRSRVDSLARSVESHLWVLWLGLFFSYLHIVMHERTKLLWFDELFTYYIAQAPSFTEMIAWTRQIDLNPPLYYIAARLSIHLFHPSSLAVRLPSMVAYSVAAVCVYQFVRHRVSPLYGTIAALILLSPAYNWYSYEARPYAFVLAFVGVAAVGWQRAIDDRPVRRWVYLLLVMLGGFGMLLSHVLALIAYGAFFIAELVRYIQRRKADWPLWISLLLPLTSCILYLPLIRNHGAGAFPPQFQASPQFLFEAYSSIWMEIAPLLAIAMILIAIFNANLPSIVERSSQKQLNEPEIVFSVSLVFVPFVITILFMYLHSEFFLRYGMPAIVGVAFLVPSFLARWTNNSQRAGLIGVAIFLFAVFPPESLVRMIQSHIHEQTNRYLTGEIQQPITQIEPDLPFVDAGGLTFLEMDSREAPTFLSRVYYLTDPKLAMEYAHSTGFNGFTLLKKTFPIRANVEPYRRFIDQHSRFLVFGSYDYPDDWLLRKLVDDGATLRFLGNFPGGYRDHQLYEVTIKNH